LFDFTDRREKAMRLNRRLATVAATAVAGAAGVATIAVASAGSGAATTILGPRATLSDSVQVNSDRIKFQTKDPTDFVVQKATFQPGGFSGWHYHPGLVMVVVESGQVTTHDENCRTKTYGAGEAFVESGTAPFMVSNESSTEQAVDFVTIVAPAGSPFRIETDPPPCA
jgi:quercetin dioxygenase-like cupin family protein